MVEQYRDCILLDECIERRIRRDVRWYRDDRPIPIQMIKFEGNGYRSGLIEGAQKGGVYIFGLHYSGKSQIIYHLRRKYKNTKMEKSYN